MELRDLPHGLSEKKPVRELGSHLAHSRCASSHVDLTAPSAAADMYAAYVRKLINTDRPTQVPPCSHSTRPGSTITAHCPGNRRGGRPFHSSDEICFSGALLCGAAGSHLEHNARMRRRRLGYLLLVPSGQMAMGVLELRDEMTGLGTWDAEVTRDVDQVCPLPVWSSPALIPPTPGIESLLHRPYRAAHAGRELHHFQR